MVNRGPRGSLLQYSHNRSLHEGGSGADGYAEGRPRASEDTDPTDTSILDFLSPELEKIHFYWLSHLWHFVMVALAE